MRRRVGIYPGVLLLLVTSTGARAEPRSSARLLYSRGPGAESCPDEVAVRNGVAARLGRDPFAETADRTISAEVSRVRSKLHARIKVTTGSGELVGQREVTSSAKDCQELGSAMELALAIAVDPLAASRPAPEPTSDPVPAPIPGPPSDPVPAPASEPEPVPVPVPVKPQGPRIPTSLLIGAGVHGSTGTVPEAAFGVYLHAAVRRGRWSIGLEGRSDFPVYREVSGGDISAALLLATLVPCHHLGPLAGCALVSGGVLRAAGHDLVDARRDTTAFAALGLRLAWQQRILGAFSLRVHGDVLAPLSETSLQVSGTEVWSTRPLAASIGLGLAGTIR